MNVKRIFSGMILCLCLLTACDISGTVTDTATGEGLEGVTVSVFSSEGNQTEKAGFRLYTTTTDPSGKYRMKSFLTRPKEGHLMVHFSKPGYVFEPETMMASMDDQNLAVVNSEGMATVPETR